MFGWCPKRLYESTQLGHTIGKMLEACLDEIQSVDHVRVPLDRRVGAPLGGLGRLAD